MNLVGILGQESQLNSADYLAKKFETFQSISAS